MIKSAFSSVDFKSIVNSFFLEISQAPLLHCIGDSHVEVFRKVEKSHFWWHTRFKFCIVPGATATGLPNPNSTTQAYRIFREYLKSISVKDSVLFCLGEVDCGFVIWWRAQKYNESVDSQTELAIQRYINFIKEVQHMGFEKIILCSAPLPTILDNQDWGEIANKRREVTAPLLERTQLTLKFNNAIKLFAMANGLKYLDLDAVTYDKITGLVNDKFRNKNPLDHHLDPDNLSREIIPMLNALGYW